MFTQEQRHTKHATGYFEMKAEDNETDVYRLSIFFFFFFFFFASVLCIDTVDAMIAVQLSLNPCNASNSVISPCLIYLRRNGQHGRSCSNCDRWMCFRFSPGMTRLILKTDFFRKQYLIESRTLIGFLGRHNKNPIFGSGIHFRSLYLNIYFNADILQRC